MDRIYTVSILAVSSWTSFLWMALLGVAGFCGSDVPLVPIGWYQHMYH